MQGLPSSIVKCCHHVPENRLEFGETRNTEEAGTFRELPLETAVPSCFSFNIVFRYIAARFLASIRLIKDCAQDTPIPVDARHITKEKQDTHIQEDGFRRFRLDMQAGGAAALHNGRQ